jgi:hypothetical protein
LDSFSFLQAEAVPTQMQSTLEDFNHTSHFIPGRQRKRSPERSMVQVRIHDMKKVVNVDKVIDVKDKLLALIGRDPSDDNITERVIFFLERLKSFSISLEVLEETSVGKCVYRFRSDPSIKVAALAEEIYQMMKAKAQEGTERRIRHKSAGIEDGAMPSSKVAKTRAGVFTSASAAAALAASAASSAASATGGVDWILQHGGSQQLDVDADIEEWEKATFSVPSKKVNESLSSGSALSSSSPSSSSSSSTTAVSSRPQPSSLRQVASSSNQYIPPPPPPPPSKSGLTLYKGLSSNNATVSTPKDGVTSSTKANAFEKLLRKK